jgi:hypothetical protein
LKANRGQIEKALDAPPPDIRFFLLYGPDEAGSAALGKRLERAMGPDAERVDLDASTLRDDPARLSDEAASFSMFGDKRWVRINGMGEESLPALTALLTAEAAGNPVIATAGALKGTSKLLKLVLDSPLAMAFASYQPDAREAEQIAVAIAREGGLRLGSDLARRIVDLANGDRALMAGEIEKLVRGNRRGAGCAVGRQSGRRFRAAGERGAGRRPARDASGTGAAGGIRDGHGGGAAAAAHPRHADRQYTVVLRWQRSAGCSGRSGWQAGFLEGKGRRHAAGAVVGRPWHCPRHPAAGAGRTGQPVGQGTGRPDGAARIAGHRAAGGAGAIGATWPGLCPRS